MPADKYQSLKARKNGPLKALQSVFGNPEEKRREEATMGGSQSKSKSSNKTGHHNNNHHHHHHHHHHSQYNHNNNNNNYNTGRAQTKDDMSIAASQTKDKLKTNPYATIKMWRPLSMDSNSATLGDNSNEEVYQTFSNFDALRYPEGTPPAGNAKANGTFHTLNDIDPATGRVPLLSYRKKRPSPPPPDTAPHSSLSSTTSDANSNGQRLDRPSQNKREQQNQPRMNGFSEPPPDPPSTPVPKKAIVRDNETPLSNGKQHKTVSFSLSAPVSSERQSTLTTNSPRQAPPPPPYPLSSPPDSSTSRIKTTPASHESNHQQSHDTSFQLVSDGATNSVKLVLSHKYDESNPEMAAKDIERLLSELKFTMESLRTSRIDKNSTQLSMCLSELNNETKNFIQEAKLFVSSANNTHAKLIRQLETAVHTLAHLFLHGQACMLMMETSHQAQTLGFHIIKAANAFKATVTAAQAAIGRSLNDPQMKYLMRQATNLANLLAALLSAIKQIKAD